jgi:hypothetical protein
MSLAPQAAAPVADPRRLFVALFAALVCVGGGARGAAAQTTHLLVVAGVGGDEEHTKKFNAWATAITTAAAKLGVPEANVRYLGEQPTPGGKMTARATRENVTRAFADLAAKAAADDTVFVVLIGHGSFDGRVGAFNLPGPDLTADDYGALLAKFPTQRVVFVNTASSSGAFLQPLAGPGRTIVTATRTGGERNETRFAEHFVAALSSEEADRDRNGRISVLEAFDFAAAKVKAEYEQSGHILTEHAAMDDGQKGLLAAGQFLAPERSRTAAAQAAPPAVRALMEARDALERQVAELRLRKDAMDGVAYEAALEKLLTELALKTRAMREAEGRK